MVIGSCIHPKSIYIYRFPVDDHQRKHNQINLILGNVCSANYTMNQIANSLHMEIPG